MLNIKGLMKKTKKKLLLFFRIRVQMLSGRQTKMFPYFQNGGNQAYDVDTNVDRKGIKIKQRHKSRFPKKQKF